MTTAFGVAGLGVYVTRRFLDDTRSLQPSQVRNVHEAIDRMRAQGMYTGGLLAEKVNGIGSVDLKDYAGRPMPGVKIGTHHHVKGLEFARVYVLASARAPRASTATMPTCGSHKAQPCMRRTAARQIASRGATSASRRPFWSRFGGTAMSGRGW